jgi:hypothetical protein
MIQASQPVGTPSFPEDKHLDINRTFLAVEGLPSLEPFVPALMRALPDALFPQDLDLRIGDVSGSDQNDAAWDFDSCMGGVTNNDDHASFLINPEEGTASWEYFRNFREESAKLLGDFFDDYQFNIFNSLPGIDLGSETFGDGADLNV